MEREGEEEVLCFLRCLGEFGGFYGISGKQTRGRRGGKVGDLEVIDVVPSYSGSPCEESFRGVCKGGEGGDSLQVSPGEWFPWEEGEKVYGKGGGEVVPALSGRGTPVEPVEFCLFLQCSEPGEQVEKGFLGEGEIEEAYQERVEGGQDGLMPGGHPRGEPGRGSGGHQIRLLRIIIAQSGKTVKPSGVSPDEPWGTRVQVPPR